MDKCRIETRGDFGERGDEVTASDDAPAVRASSSLTFTTFACPGSTKASSYIPLWDGGRLRTGLSLMDLVVQADMQVFTMKSTSVGND